MKRNGSLEAVTWAVDVVATKGRRRRGPRCRAAPDHVREELAVRKRLHWLPSHRLLREGCHLVCIEGELVKETFPDLLHLYCARGLKDRELANHTLVLLEKLVDRAGDLREEHRLRDALEAQALRFQDILQLDELGLCLGKRLGLRGGEKVFALKHQR